MGHYIVILPDMIAAFDREQPNPGRATSAFIMRWKRKEMEEKHTAHNPLAEAVRMINRAEIQNIRETKKFRDERHEVHRVQRERRMIREFAVESE